VLRADGRVVDLEARQRLRRERERRGRRRGRRGLAAAAQRHQRDRALSRRVESEQPLDRPVRKAEHDLRLERFRSRRREQVRVQRPAVQKQCR
jgi:hypothetical protein